MKFNFKSYNLIKHTELLACVELSNMNELFSVGDDKAILKWDINGEPGWHCNIGEDFYNEVETSSAIPKQRRKR